MKKTKFLVLAVLAAMFVGCQSEEPEQISENDRPSPTGDTRIIIEGEGMLDTQSRSSDGRVDFTGGYATGAGLYNGSDQPMVAAYPNAGYEVSYFYGGPASEPKKYDYAQNQSSTFNVDLGGQDHTFHCGFKEKKRTLTVNAGSGGKVSPSGTKEYQVEKPISITATPNSGYEFSGWSITGGDVTIANPNSSSTTATLNSTSETITANFKQNMPYIQVSLSGSQRQETYMSIHYTYQSYQVQVSSSPEITGTINATVVLEGTASYTYPGQSTQTEGWQTTVSSLSRKEYIAYQVDTQTGNQVRRSISKKYMSQQPFYIDGTLYTIASDNTITYRGTKYKVILNF